MSKYDDIINLERPISKKRMPMSIENRAAQFAPFSALTGYEDAVKETARITDSKKILSEGIKEIINEKINYIKNNLKTIVEVKITYFLKDKKKTGGKYTTITDLVKKIDINNCLIYLSCGTIISFDDISNIDNPIFDYLGM